MAATARCRSSQHQHQRRQAPLVTLLALLALSYADAQQLAPASLNVSSANADAAAWRTFNGRLGASAAYGSSSGNVPADMVPVLAHAYSTPLDAIKSSYVYRSGSARFRRVVADLQAGKPVTVAAVGGPATNGSAASRPGRNDYFARYVNYLGSAFPTASVTPVRSSVGVAPSSVVAYCSDRYLPPAADLIILEMVNNDATAMDVTIVNSPIAQAYELLVRRALAGSKQPAVILLQTLADGQGNATRAFYLTPEAPQFSAVSAYYDLPYLSLRNALWDAGTANSAGLVSMPQASPVDGATLLDDGHASLLDLLVFLTQQTALDLKAVPYGASDAAQLVDDVPPAMTPAVSSKADVVLANVTCTWMTNISAVPRGQCPQLAPAVCNLDYTSLETARSSAQQAVSSGALSLIADAESTSINGDSVGSSEAGDGGGSSKTALIAGLVGGIGGGLLLIGSLLGLAVWARKRREARLSQVIIGRPEWDDDAPIKVPASVGMGVPIHASANGRANGHA